jgi:predicted nucleic acid-binding protein
VKAAYVDTSCIVAIAFGEADHPAVTESLRAFDMLLASNLLEAELQAVLVRERVADRLEELVAGIHWILPDRPLSPEIQRVAQAGYVRGADLWHLACALVVDPEPSELVFATLDRAQGETAEALGFRGL